MQRDIGRVTYYPTIVSRRSGRDVEERAGAKVMDCAVFHRGRGTTGEYQVIEKTNAEAFADSFESN